MEETPQEPQPLTPPPRRKIFIAPLVTMGLILANVVVHLLVARSAGVTPLQSMFLGSQGGDAETWQAWEGALEQIGWNARIPVQNGDYWRLITAVFLHGGIVHLGCNMIGLWNLGQFMEMAYGRARFLAIYVGSGIAGSLASITFAPGPSVGASGAIFGLIGCGLLFSLRYRKHLPPGAGSSIFTQLMIWTVVILAVGHYLRVFDNAGHIGGLVGGIIITAPLHSRFSPFPPGRVERILARCGFIVSVLVLGVCFSFIIRRTFPPPGPSLERTYHGPPGWRIDVPRTWEGEIVDHKDVHFRDSAYRPVMSVLLQDGGEEVLERTPGEFADWWFRRMGERPRGRPVRVSVDGMPGFRFLAGEGTRCCIVRGSLVLIVGFWDSQVPEETREAILRSLMWGG